MKHATKITAVMVLVFSLFLMTCDNIGLGEAVDIEAPVVTISYPPSASIIRDTFVMAGTVEEDVGLSSVVVSYEDADGVTQTRKATLSNLNSTEKQWRAEVNLATAGVFDLADGKYNFTVTATDTSDRQGSASVTYTIDNTSPILVITQPSTVDSTKEWEFGAQIEFAGMQYDENAGDLFEINFFDENKKFVANTEFSTPIQNFTFSTGTGVFDELKAYASSFPEIYWYSIAVYDNAFEYKDPKELKANDKVDNSKKKGNHSKHYYSWSQITSLLQVNDGQPKISALYELDNGKTLSSDEMPSSITYEKLQELRLPYASETVVLPENVIADNKLGVFSIDPDNVRPSISIDGLDANHDALGNQIARNASLRIEFKKALDGIYDINMNAARYRLDSCFDGTTWTEGEWLSFTDYVSGSSIIVNQTGPNLIGKYRLVFDVKDYNDTGAKTAEPAEWEFYVNSGAPSVTLYPGTNINSKIYAKDNKMDISVVAEDDSDALKLTIYEMDENLNYRDEEGKSIEIEESLPDPLIEKGNDGRYSSTWNLSLKAPNDGEKRGFYIVVSDGKFDESISRVFTVDTTSPELKELTSPSLVAEKDYSLNESNIVTIKGYADSDLEKALFTYTTENTKPTSSSAKATSWTGGSVDDSQQEREINGEMMFVKGFNANLNLPFVDGKAEEGIYYLWYRFADDTYDEATDSYGEILPLGKVFVDSAAPALKDSVGTETIQYVNKEVVLSGTLSDGNGIKEFVLQESFNNGEYETKKIVYDSTTGAWSYTIPYNADHSKDGVYTYRITATDNAEKTTAIERNFVVDTTSPNYYFGGIDSTVLNGDDSYFVNGTITINGSVDGENLASATYKIAGETGSNSLGSSWKIEFDTTQFADGKKLSEVLAFQAVDNAGNAFDFAQDNELKAALEKYVINQDSDKPSINLSQSVDVAIKNENSITVGSNLFGAGVDKFYGTFTDDDGIKSVQYAFVVADADKTITDEDFTAYDVTANAKTVAFNLNLAEKDGDLYRYGEGLYKAQFVVTDKNGLQQKTEEFLFAIDRSSPTLTNDTASGEYKTTEFVVSGTYNDASGKVKITRSVSSVAGEEAAGKSVLTFENDVWSDSISNAQTGTHVIDYTATDKYGRATTIKFTFMVDDKAPTLTITEPNVKSVFSDESTIYRVEGTATDEGPSGLKGIYYYISKGKDAAAPAFDVNTWTVATGLAHWTALVDFTDKTEENYTIHFATSDNAGNIVVEETGIPVTIDTKKPSIVVSEVNSGFNNFHKENFVLLGTASDDRGISSVKAVLISGETETVLENKGTATSWQFNIPVAEKADGAYSVKITALDTYNRESSTTYAFAIDKTAPVVEIAVPGNGEYVSVARKTMKGSFVEEGSGVKSLQYSLQKEGETENWQAVTPVGASWTLQDLLIGTENSEGTYVLKLKLVDNLGHEGETSVSFVKDLYKPTLTLTETSRLITSGDFSLAGTAFDSNELKSLEITALVQGEAKKWVPSINDKNWQQNFTVSGDTNAENYIPNGTYDFDVIATDVIGQTVQVKRSVVIDTSKPAVEFDEGAIQLFTDENAEYRIEGTAKDIGDSGLKAVYYLLSEGEVTTTPNTLDVSVWQLAKGIENWNTTLSFADKNEKVYTVFVGALDAAGNSYIVPNGKVIILDSGKPIITANSLTAQYFDKDFDVTGKVSDDTDISSVKAVLISGETETALENAGTLSDWQFSIPVANNADGDYSVKITALDTYNRESSTTYAFSIDKTAPVVEIVVPSENEHISLNTKTLRGNLVEEGSGIKSLKYRLYTGNEPGDWIEISNNTNSSWTLQDLALGVAGSEGEYILELAVEDNLGMTTTDSVSFVKDLNSPELTTETSDLIVSDAFTLSGSATDSYSLKEVVLKTKVGSDEKKWTLTASGNSFAWEKEFVVSGDGENSLPSGIYTFDIIAVDSVGQTSQAKRKIIVDTTKPTLSGNAFAESGYKELDGNKWNRTGSLALTVNATDGESGIKEVSYAIISYATFTDDKTYPSDTDWQAATWIPCVYKGTSYSATLSFEEDGANFVNIRVLDNAGNEALLDAYDTIYVDTAAPSVSFDSVNGSTDTQVLINGENALEVKLKAEGEDSSTSGIESIKLALNEKTNSAFKDSSLVASKSDDGVYTCTITKEVLATVTGDFTVYAQISDKVENKSGAVTLFQVKKDSEAPTAEITSHANNSTVNGKITLTGTTTESQGLAKVAIFVNDLNSALTIFEGNAGFNWSYEIDTTTYYNGTEAQNLPIKVVATDNAGNTGTTSIELTIDQKTDRPEITINNSIDETNKVILKYNATIGGPLSDDDGLVKSVKLSFDGGSNWNDAVLNDTGTYWTYENIPDGTHTIHFEVVDAKDKTFRTTEISDVLKQPLVYDKDKQGKTGAIKIVVDNAVPSSGSLTISFDNGTTKENFSNNMVAGGANSAFTLYVEASDPNGIESVKAALGTTSIVGTASAENGNGEWTLIGFDVTKKDSDDEYLLPDGTNTLTITITDNAGLENTITRSVLVDNTVPVLKIESHANREQVTGTLTLRGSADDGTNPDGTNGSGIANVQWMIPTVTDASSITKDSEGWKENSNNGTLSWNIKFETEGQLLASYANETYGTDEESNNIWTVPIYFRVEDKAGNVLIYKDFSFLIDPDGDKPTVEISYPSNGDKLGGTIRLYGSAKDNVSISSVYMQIDVNGDGFFNDTDKEALPTLAFPYVIEEFAATQLNDNTSWWGIKVTGSASWNQAINSKGEFNPTESGQTRTIHVRFRALDNNELCGRWTDALSIIVDKTAPRVGSSIPLAFVQYSDNDNGTGEIVAKKEYTEGIWLKGNWWLIGSVEDESGIASITLESNNSEHVTLTGSLVENASWFTPKTFVQGTDDTSDDTLGYEFKIPIKTETFASNLTNCSFILNVVDSSTPQQSATPVVSIKYDNTAPSTKELYHGALKIGDGSEQSTVIQQSDNAFNIKSESEDDGSGFARMAVYFLREGKEQTRIYNPTLTQGSAGNLTELANEKASETVSLIDGIPRLYVSGVTRGTTETITHAAIEGNANIAVGGLVRIGGQECRITEVFGDTVKITPAVDTIFTEAEFAYALIVDNFVTETPTYTDGIITNIENSDGDNVVESIKEDGGLYTWSLSIDSKNIPDGPLYICYVAYDKAGNISSVEKVLTSVQNNRPAIAKVWLGTDLNGDGEIVETEEVLVRNVDESKVQENRKEEIYTDSEISIDATSLFTAKDKTTIRPEIVGGNGDLYYYIDSLGHTAKTLREDSAITPITLGASELENYDDRSQNFFVKIWDSTEELTGNATEQENNTSQWASMDVSFKVDVLDGIAPVIGINPLYWNSKTDNSLYGMDVENGHIELSDDLSFVDSTFTENSGVMDKDDKVSGKITFTGTAYDDVRLTSLSFSFDEFNGTTTFDTSSNTWSVLDKTIETDGYEFSVVPVSFDQSGHSVNWTFSVDTEKIDGIAKEDVTLVITAIDKGSNSASADDKVDVVPYITGVQTSLSNSNKKFPTSVSRSALGKYPVYEGEIVTLTGFNLTVTTISVSDSGKLAYSGAGQLLNNLNNNDAKGSYTDVLTQDNYADYAYNRQPNNYNNNLLTDDIEFVVWQFDSDAVIPKSGKIEQPIMKINPNTKEVGFAFVNGPLYFSMGGNGYSYRYWMGSYDFFTSVGFTYDDLGYSYGVAAGGDINSTQADKFQFMTSRWGRAGLGRGGSYSNTNSLRLESIAMKVDGVDYYDKQRIKSPAFATTVNGTTSNIYLAYYDAMNDEIRFKAGSTNSTSRTNFGNFTDYDTQSEPYVYRHGSVSMIAGSDTERNAGEYISLGAIKGVQSDGSDVVIVVWYGSDRTLWYSYTTSSPMDREGETDGSGWSTPKAVFPEDSDMANAGEYCKVITDKDGGVHIAAYDPVNLDLCYAYLSSYDDTSFETCVVDSNGVTGSNLTLDVAKVDNNWIAYIGYYATYCIKPKYAYKVLTTENAPAGSIDDMFTQTWESMVVPTSSTIEMQSNQHNDINIAVWKDKDSGVIENSETGTNSHDTNNNGYNTDAYGYVYGNGTSNPIMGYAIKSGASANTIETAQMK